MKTKKVISFILVLLIGYVLGIIISFPEVDSSILSGDIGKAAKYSKSTNVEVNALQERLESDSLFRKNMAASLILADCRISQFKSLTEATGTIAGNISALEGGVRPIMAMKEFAGVAKANADSSLAAFAALLKGEGVKSGYDYESLSQKMMISSMAIDKQYDAVRSFVSGVDAYLKQHKEKVEGLQELRDSWVLFFTREAAMNGRKHEMEYWKQQNVLSDNEDLLDFIPIPGFLDNENLLDCFIGLPGFPDNENLLDCYIGLQGFPDNENLLDCFVPLAGFPDNEDMLDIFPGLSGFPDNQTLNND